MRRSYPGFGERGYLSSENINFCWAVQDTAANEPTIERRTPKTTPQVFARNLSPQLPDARKLSRSQPSEDPMRQPNTIHAKPRYFGRCIDPRPDTTGDVRRANLLPLWPHEFNDPSLPGRRRRIELLRRALRAERQRGLAGHWTYDLARHWGLLRWYRLEVSEYAALLRKGEMVKS
jgi:hypothetical protein